MNHLEQEVRGERAHDAARHLGLCLREAECGELRQFLRLHGCVRRRHIRGSAVGRPAQTPALASNMAGFPLTPSSRENDSQRGMRATLN